MHKMNNNRSTGKTKVNNLNKRFELYAEANAVLKEKLVKGEELTTYEEAIQFKDLRCIEFAFKFYKLSSVAIDIIMFLHLNGGFFLGGYSDLTQALGRKTGPKGHAPNIRNMCNVLEEQGIIIIYRDKKKHWPIQIDLCSDWMNKI